LIPATMIISQVQAINLFLLWCSSLQRSSPKSTSLS
jgi:hypothetical protein